MSKTVKEAAIAAFVILAHASPAGAAELKVLCTTAMRTTMLDMGARFERATGHKLVMSIAPSAQLVRRIQNGEAADLVIGFAPGIDELIKDGKIAGSRHDLARSLIGLSVRAGAPKPDISSPEALKRALLAAKAVAYSTGGISGNHFVSVLEKLGIANEVKAKSKLGAPAAAFVANGEADIAVQQIPELIAVAGTELVGPLPRGLEHVTQFSAGLLAGAKEPDAARALVKFLMTEEAAAVITAKGLTPG
ncbi:MAG: substrate-binding domain-containing protein [Pseudomonadota bacterium]|nr:substrate-binding domain-containing protein [Pseudomonadota bacterium]